MLDRAVGQSYLQIAMRGRSLHRSQDMGVLQRIGPSAIRLRIIEDRTGMAEGRTGVFAGMDTTLAGLLGPQAPPGTAERARALGGALARLNPWDLGGGRLPSLRAELGSLLDSARAASPAGADQLRRLDEALVIASGVICDALSATDRLWAGARVPITLSCWNTSSDTVEVSGALTFLGHRVREMGPSALAPGAIMAETTLVQVPTDVPPTSPYFLRLPKMAGASLYRWPAGPEGGDPFEPPPAMASFRLGRRGAAGGTLDREVVYRYNDQAIGEVRRPLFLVPAVTLSLSPGVGIWPLGDRSGHSFTLTVHSEAGDSVAGEAWLDLPAGWEVEGPRRFVLSARGAEQTLAFTVRPSRGAKEGRYPIRAVARDEAGRQYEDHLVRIEYPHLRPRQVTRTAGADVVVARIARPAAGPIAYVRGAADRVPEALEALGVPVVLLGPDSLARGDLSGFRTIVVGPRAYETEPALLDHSARLLDYARAGGTVLVQYQQQTYFGGGFAPYPLALAPSTAGGGGGGGSRFRAAPRVADETAPVTVLDSTDPAFRTPNPITGADWDGWVQERGLYFAAEWGSAWRPLLEMADPGSEPLQGSLLVARVGRGLYLYTGLSFFRELPAAVPGAARLFLNLLALRAADGG